MLKIVIKTKTADVKVIDEGKVYPIDSSAIKYARWTRSEPHLGSLEIQFASGYCYRFGKVPEKVFEGLLKAESAGTFFNKSIRGFYEYKQMEPYKLNEKETYIEEQPVYSEEEEDQLETLVDTVKNDTTIEKIGVGGLAYTRYKDKNLEVEFENGNCYVFIDVPRSTYEDFLKVSAKASFYNKNIYSKYDFKIIDPVTLSSAVK